MVKFVELFGVVAILAGVAGPGMSLLDFLERQFIFFPVAEVERTPADLGLPFEDVQFRTDDGFILSGWFIPASAGNNSDDTDRSDVTLLWLHGNGGNIGHRVDDLALFHHLLGVNVFIFDYRGYGNSQGQPSERGVYGDSRAALSYVNSRADAYPDRVVYFGRSLGAAVAVELAMHQEPAGMILFSPFTSIAELGKSLYPASPVRLLAGKRFDSLSRIRQYQGPLLVIHGTADEIIPFDHGRRLFEAANHPKRFHEIPGATHNDGLGEAGAPLWNAIGDFLESLSDDGPATNASISGLSVPPTPEPFPADGELPSE